MVGGHRNRKGNNSFFQIGRRPSHLRERGFNTGHEKQNEPTKDHQPRITALDEQHHEPSKLSPRESTLNSPQEPDLQKQNRELLETMRSLIDSGFESVNRRQQENQCLINDKLDSIDKRVENNEKMLKHLFSFLNVTLPQDENEKEDNDDKESDSWSLKKKNHPKPKNSSQKSKRLLPIEVDVFLDSNCSSVSPLVSALNERLNSSFPKISLQLRSRDYKPTLKDSLCLYVTSSSSSRIKGFYDENYCESVKNMYRDILFLNVNYGKATLPSNEGHESLPSGYTNQQGIFSGRVIQLGLVSKSKELKDSKLNDESLKELESIIHEVFS
eukprot:gb/GECH01011790.1/.p1 GENE.gb/GECH01011790.1/~~gb/GECH01011790.1/.p1  ORF type:complete len:328 (+),score=71.09 gb/GECH01011790.1/:1-984(+)